MEKIKSLRKWVFIALLLAIGIVLSACGSGITGGTSGLPEGTYPVDPVFQDFYDTHGGVDVFGYAISSSYTTVQGRRGQYFETVLLVYDANTQTVFFESLGNDLDLGQLPVYTWNGPTEGGVFVGEHFIHPDFASLYLSLGPELVGQPLTDPVENLSQNRIEQHFESMGFYIDLNDPNATASLLFYGRMHCGGCNSQRPLTENAIVEPMLADRALYSRMKEMGISLTTAGNLVQGPLTRYDGTKDIIFDYLVLYEQDGSLGIRNVPELMGLKENQMYYPSPDNIFVFYEIADGGGFNVLYLFNDFILEHGGYQVSGQPISSLSRLNANTEELRQCFQHYCLDYNPAGNPVVKPVPLGELYFQGNQTEYVQPKIGSENESGDFGDGSGGTKVRNQTPFTLIAQEDHYNIDSQTQQVLTFWVKLQETPQPGMNLVLKVTYPDGHEEMVSLSPTDQEGKTSQTLAPIAGQNGSLVRYEACLSYGDLPPACVEQVFMIWGNP
jgi:hypothetical protein